MTIGQDDHLTTNLIENFGLSYNSIRNILTYFMGMEESAIKSAYKFGENLGFAFFYILYPGA
jgi:hypothetical protein